MTWAWETIHTQVMGGGGGHTRSFKSTDAELHHKCNQENFNFTKNLAGT